MDGTSNENDGYGDQRCYPRVKLSTRIDLVLDGQSGFVSGRTNVISERGVFIEIEDSWPPGTSFRFGLRPRAGVAPVRGSAEVVWVRREAGGPDRPAGMGARFQDVDEEGLDILRSLVIFEADEGEGATSEGIAADEMDLADTIPDAPGPQGGDSEADIAVTREIEPVRPLRDDHHVQRGRKLGRRLAATMAVLAAGILAALLFVAWYGDAETDLLGRLLRRGGAADGIRTGGKPVETGVDRPSSLGVARQPMRVEDVRASTSSDGSVVVIHGSDAFSLQQVSSERLENPPRYVVRLFGMTAPFPRPTIDASGPGLRGIRVGQHADGSKLETRVVLDLSSSVAQVEQPAVLGNKVVVRITN